MRSCKETNHVQLEIILNKTFNKIDYLNLFDYIFDYSFDLRCSCQVDAKDSLAVSGLSAKETGQ